MAEVLEVNQENFESEILKSDKPALVDFWAPWCGPCRMMHPVIEGIAGEFEGRAVVSRCNVDDNPDIAGRYGIKAIPTLIAFKGGELVRQMVGVTSEAELKKLLESML